MHMNASATSSSLRTARRLRRVLAVLATTALVLSSGALAQGGWPRTFTNADGSTTEIPAQPQRILSTAVSITGTLLAIDAPVVGSGSAGNGTYFAQWADVAEERGVVNVWPAGSVDLEAAYAVQPDLIIVSTSGGDSALAQLGELQQVAPTIILDYGGQTWQSLAAQIGEATGLEQQVTDVIAGFDAQVAAAAAAIDVPDGTANIISYNGAGTDNPIARVGGAHAELLAALGFTVEDPPVAWHSQANTRADFVWAAFERLPELTSETTFLLRFSDDQVGPFLAEPVLANLPSVVAGQVYGLGANSFRIDYYSALEIVEHIVATFGN